MPNYRQDIVLSYGALLDELGKFMDYAQRRLRPDQAKALEGTGTKLVLTLENHMKQAGYLLDQYERMSGETSRDSIHPSGRPPSRVVVPFRRR